MKRVVNLIFNVILPWRWWSNYRRYIDKITESGFVGPISPRAVAVTKAIFRFWRWVQVGKVTVIGREHLNTPGRVVYVANHSSMMDVICAFPEMERECRAIGAIEPLRAFGGLPAVLMTKVGVVPVDRSKGKTVIQPSIDVVAAGSPIGLFPEGKISPTGELLPYKPGFAIIANGAFDKNHGKEKVAIVVVQFCYGKRHAPSAFNYLKMGLRWRGGLTLTVCKPIWLDQLPKRDVTTLMQLVRQTMEAIPCPTTFSPTASNGGKHA